MTLPTDKIVLTYWPLQGLGAACRLALIHAVGIDGFVDNVVTKEWSELLKTIGETEQPMLNMPFIKFPGTPAIAQSNCVLLAIGRRYNLGGTSIEDKDLIDEVLNQMADYHQEYCKLTYGCTAEQFEEWKSDFNTKTIPYYFGGLDKLLKLRNVQWFGGSAVSVADFKVYANALALSVLNGKATVAEALAAYPHLTEWLARMEALPSVQTYRSSPMGKLAMNGHSALWDPAR